MPLPKTHDKLNDLRTALYKVSQIEVLQDTKIDRGGGPRNRALQAEAIVDVVKLLLARRSRSPRIEGVKEDLGLLDDLVDRILVREHMVQTNIAVTLSAEVLHGAPLESDSDV